MPCAWHCVMGFAYIISIWSWGSTYEANTSIVFIVPVEECSSGSFPFPLSSPSSPLSGRKVWLGVNSHNFWACYWLRIWPTSAGEKMACLADATIYRMWKPYSHSYIGCLKLETLLMETGSNHQREMGHWNGWSGWRRRDGGGGRFQGDKGLPNTAQVQPGDSMRKEGTLDAEVSTIGQSQDGFRAGHEWAKPTRCCGQCCGFPYKWGHLSWEKWSNLL